MQGLRDSVDDQQPAVIFFSWIFFMILAAQVVIKVPRSLATTGALRLAELTGSGAWIHPDVCQALYLASSLILVPLCAVAFAGYLLRTFPPRAVGSSGLTYLGAFVASTVSGSIFPFAAWLWAGEWSLGIWRGTFIWLGWLFYLWWNLARGRSLRRPYVLFLRRFDTFADLALLRALLRLTPRGTPVVLLVGGDEREAGVWDPTTLIIFGWMAVLPFAGRPLFLDGGEQWRSVMESLVERCAVMVFETTKRSPSVDLEIAAIERLGRSGSVIELSEEGGAPRPDCGDSKERLQDRLATIQYRRSYLTMLLPVVLVVAVAACVADYSDLPRQLTDAAAQGELAGAVFGAAIMMGLLSIFLGFLIVRRSLDRESRNSLAMALRAGLTEGRRRA